MNFSYLCGLNSFLYIFRVLRTCAEKNIVLKNSVWVDHPSCVGKTELRDQKKKSVILNSFFINVTSIINRIRTFSFIKSVYPLSFYMHFFLNPSSRARMLLMKLYDMM